MRYLCRLWLLLIISCVAWADTPPIATAPALGPGMTLLTERQGDGPWAIFVLKVERAHPEYRLVGTLARGTIFGLATVPEQAKSLPAALGVPVAAINGDWFDMPAGPYQGDLLNLFIDQGELVSTPSWGDTFWMDAKGQPHLDHVTADVHVTWPDGTCTPLGLDGPRADDAAVLYTPILGPSTHTIGGRELVLERAGDGPWLPLRVGNTCAARVREVRDAGDSPLTTETMILSLGPALLPKLPQPVVGATLTLTVATTPSLKDVELAIGGGPILLRDGKVPVAGVGEQPRHPRTVIGWNDTHFFFIVVDGRRPGWSVGMTTPELSALAQRLGCTNALNLDGGGSSTLWLPDAVVNLPSDGKPRPVGNALVFVRWDGVGT